ncbi:hypothetical protein FHR83_000319 [Actinoplanes campanulatus]|uniref:Methyltransferase domain-containing protein n=1 Tax=Actinoplanes campanulatus TaxID=113559 RepID=A0A7W5AAY3_9ACTN|nr:hypothetical protein [Actinoplanes campanulatus]MBB3092685.1 hypothetical protein [Actinoplanes campanulatus]GGM98281.1 hypothetical protein GCM10010109_02470 [Actinoplanes campanulatus]GID34218.1 hypothetical protein Aca09nite_07240 [Actinoplanes campanulatus]
MDHSPGLTDFPADESGRRSSIAFGRSVVADALRHVDPAAAAAAERESDWRRGYLRHFRALVETGLAADGSVGYEIAEAGLASVQARVRYRRDDGDFTLAQALLATPDRPLDTVEVKGSGEPEREVVLPYRGELLRGDGLRRRLDAWVAAGVIEDSCAEAVREVAGSPDWLDLSDQTLVALGAGTEMGPVASVLGWGGTVVAVDLPRPHLWERVEGVAAQSAGRLLAPAAGPTPGADLLRDLAAVAQWLLGIDGRLVLGNYVYAPGSAYPLLAAAVDALGTHLRHHRPDTALAFLATPTDVYAVPAAAVTHARERYAARSRRARATAALSGGRLLRPNYPCDVAPGLNDSLVPQQGPNYALAKRIHRWRATVTRRDGVVSFAVAPPTRTRSVLQNRLLAAAYAGAHLFDVETFEPATASRLMALLLVHQLRKPRAASPAAWQDEAAGAAHGGLWRAAYHPRTALPLAAVRGLVLPR